MSASFDRYVPKVPIPDGHIPDAMLDEFVMEMLSEPERACWEEHLLICARCQDRVRETDEYIRVIKGAAAEISEFGAGTNRPFNNRPVDPHSDDVQA